MLDAKVPLQDRLGTFESIKGHEASKAMQKLSQLTEGRRTERMAQMLFMKGKGDANRFCVATLSEDVPETIEHELKLAVN